MHQLERALAVAFVDCVAGPSEANAQVAGELGEALTPGFLERLVDVEVGGRLRGLIKEVGFEDVRGSA